jgi:hypothetical protein
MVDRGIALPFRDFDPKRGGWSAPLPGRFTPGKDPVLIVQKAGWAPGPVCEKSRPHREFFLFPNLYILQFTIFQRETIRSPDRPARSHSLYRLTYPAHCYK